MFKRIFVICTGYILFTCSGCNQPERGEGDMVLLVHRNAGGEKIREGELIELTAVEKSEAGTIIWNSADDVHTALLTRRPSAFAGDLFAALGQLGEGDSATIKINRDSMVHKMGVQLPRHVQGEYIIYEVSIRRVLHKGRLSDSAYQQAVNRFVQERMSRLQQDEIARSKNYSGKRAYELGSTMPVFAFTNIVNDVIIQNEDLLKGPSVFIFIGTSCDHCQQLVQDITRHQRQLQKLNLYLVALEPLTTIRDFIQQYAPSLNNKKNIMILEDRERRFMPAFQASVFPSVYVYNEQHILVKHRKGDVSIKDLLP